MKTASILLLTIASLTCAQKWIPGKSTHYGPFPSDPTASEAGYRANEVGVGCSVGKTPQWEEILSHGTYNNTADPGNIWPIIPTVAVSQYIYQPIRDKMCFAKIQIRNANNHSATVEASVVDWCPSNGCLWSKEERAFNVDVYGEKTWFALGGQGSRGTLDIEIQWPAGVDPYALSQRSGDTGGLSAAAKGGIAAAVIIILIVLGVGGWFGWKKWKTKRLLDRYSTGLPSMGEGHRQWDRAASTEETRTQTYGRY
ncbi:hypothetical protein HK097_003293 [Rhizophlyctis rosea]|uniref:Uncharacterized protein n=1 Tax=Rhizophlyctis rosea TaxID=64517 RepID=A0AAD5SG05_9FUNG|nr:hypothetical protein HK097_003293 [Rhizophlyctis rosea]